MSTAVEWGVLPAGAENVIEAATRTAAEKTAARFEAPMVCRLRDPQWAPGREWQPAASAPLLKRIADLTTYRDELLNELGTWKGEV